MASVAAARVSTAYTGATFEERLEKVIETVGDGRTLEEALGFYTQCQQCDKFRGHFCSKDKGCDKGTVFVIRLAKRNCVEWK